MASPAGLQPVEAPEAGTTELFLKFAVGAVGAISSIATAGAASIGGTAQSKAFKLPNAAGTQQAVARTGVGAYDVNLAEAWLALLDYHIETVGTIAAAEGSTGKVITDASGTASAPKVSIQFYDRNTGVAAEVPSGASVIVRLTLKRSLP